MAKKTLIIAGNSRSLENFVDGERICLRPLKKADCEKWPIWFNNQEVTHYLFSGIWPMTLEDALQEFENIRQECSGRKSVVCAVVVKNKKREVYIGNTGLYGINWQSRHAEFRVHIGEKSFWNKGYGTEATELICGYGFNRLGLNLLYLGVNAEHEGAIKAYKKAGFVLEGKRPQYIWRNGRYYDAVFMHLLAKDFVRRGK